MHEMGKSSLINMSSFLTCRILLSSVHSLIIPKSHFPSLQAPMATIRLMVQRFCLKEGRIIKRIAARGQICTQHAYTRPYGIVAMILGIDEEKGTPQLFTCDPAGQVFGHKAVSAGFKEREAMDFLEKKMMSNPSLSFESTTERRLIPKGSTL